ncbi:MAG: TonB-dependent receptor [Cyclobacteriaceae bacterium]
MTRIAVFTLLLFYQFTLYGQKGQEKPLIISGSIVDSQGNFVPFANAAMYNNLDSTLVGGAVSDEDGLFFVQIKPGNYYLKVTFLSFEEKIVPNVNLINNDVELGKIVLQANTRLLETVEIEGQKSQMELQLDKRVFHVGTDLTSTGGSAADILNNVPSVSVEVDGTVSLRGNENVRILINGKPSGLTSRDPDALRQLQGNLVERVEVITNPSSRYEAAGEVGIINIVLKKNQENGLNGTLTGTAGHPDLVGGSYSLNLRRKKINLFSSYGVNYRKSPGYSRMFQSFEGGSRYTRQNSDQTRSLA